MLDFEDRWWLISVIVLVLLWVMGAVIPIRMVTPTLNVTRGYVQLEDEDTEDVPPPPHRPGVILPLLVFLVALGLVYVSVRKRIEEPEGGTRWTWMAAAAGIAAFWALILILITMRLAARVG